MISALLLSLAVSQFTGPQINGLVKALNDSVATINPGNPATISGNGLVTFGGTVAANTPCIRCTIRLTEEQRLFLGVPAGTIAEPADLYAVMQVCGNPVVPYQKMPPWMEELIQTCSASPILASAGWSVVTLAARSNPVAQAAATGFACACSTGASCNWTPPLVGGGFGSSTPAPKNLTLPPGLWSGAGCSLKPCVEMYGSDSMANACK